MQPGFNRFYMKVRCGATMSGTTLGGRIVNFLKVAGVEGLSEQFALRNARISADQKNFRFSPGGSGPVGDAAAGRSIRRNLMVVGLVCRRWGTAGALALLAMASAAAQTQINQFFDDTVVQNVYLTVAPSDWTSLLQNYESDTYYQATFNWQSITETIGIRQHGQGTRSPVKPNLDFDFGHYQSSQTLLGESKIILKANNDDPSDLHEWISMKLFARMGFPAPRESFAVIYVNGSVFGFYLILEHDDPSFVQRNLGESGGYLYNWKNQGDDYDFGNRGTNPILYLPYLDLKSDQATPDLQTFANLVRVINQRSDARFTDADFIAALSQYTDPNSFLTYAATDNVLAEADGLVGGLEGMNNFLLYQYEGTTVYQLIPWDKALAFSLTNRDIMDGFTNGPNINVLAQRLVGIPAYQTVYLGQLMRAVNLMGGTGGWADTEITQEYNIINDAASNDDPYKQCVAATGGFYTCGAADFQNGVDWLHSFFPARGAFVSQEVSTYGYQAPTGLPNISAVTIAVPGGAAAMAPGSLNYVTGSNLGVMAQESNIPLPRNLSGTFVAVQGVRAPLLSTSSGQIEIQAPWDLPVGEAPVVVSVNGVMSDSFISAMQSTAPGIFAVTHLDGSTVDAASPVNGGETIVVYMVGLGAVNGTLADGAATPANPPLSTVSAPQMTIANAPLTISFSGLTPGLIGIYQVNAAAPASFSQSGSAAMQVTAAGQTVTAPIAVN
jgi:uncharacterized protein (TIGR03437 family)